MIKPAVVQKQGDRIVVSGALTLSSVASALGEGVAAIAQGARTVDLGEVGELDSSALALLLAWLREAKRRDASLSFTRLPEGLTTIARLYGIAELLPGASSQPH
jgi:phospholipid transport system transporter-binding protein